MSEEQHISFLARDWRGVLTEVLSVKTPQKLVTASSLSNFELLLRVFTSHTLQIPLSRLSLQLPHLSGNPSTIVFDISCGGLLGGKGGFGSLLRQAGKVSKTRNKSAMRDLYGRRMRYSEQEKELLEWMREQKRQREEGSQTDIREVQRDFAYLKRYGRMPEKHMCHRGAECRYRDRCRFRHPDDDVRLKQQQFDATLRKGRKRDLSSASETDSAMHSSLPSKKKRFPDASLVETLGALQYSHDEDRMKDALTMGMRQHKRKKIFEELKSASIKSAVSNATSVKLKDAAATTVLSDDTLISDSTASVSTASVSVTDSGVSSTVEASAPGMADSKLGSDSSAITTTEVPKMWNGIDIAKIGLFTKKHSHKLIFNLRRDCDFVICNECERAYIGHSWHCRDRATVCDFDLCPDCLDFLDDVYPKEKQDFSHEEIEAELRKEMATRKPVVAVERTSASDAGIGVSEREEAIEQEIKGKIDLSDYSSAVELESVGLEPLKEELQLYGLKCGGNLSQRASRLFLLKRRPLDTLPRKVFAAKPRKKRCKA